MSDEKKSKPDTKNNPDVAPPAVTGGKTPMFNPKILFIGLPIFIVQLVLVYFITANILFSTPHKTSESEVQSDSTQTGVKEGEQEGTSKEVKSGDIIHSLDDIIVNPAQTNGKTLLLASVGFDVKDAEGKKSLEDKQVVVKDVIISVLSSKNTEQLSRASYRDTIKTEILSSLKSKIPEAGVSNVYFSKFIIQ